MKTEAEEARDEAVARVGSSLTEDEKLDLLINIGEVAERLPDFTTDDIRFDLDVDRRAIGYLMKRAAKEGFCTRTDITRVSKQVVCHARPKAVWVSNLFQEQR